MAKVKRALLWILLAIAVLLMLCGIVYYLSLRVLHTLSHITLSLGEWQAWAILITVSLPVVAVGAFLLGRRDARMLSDGMRMGVNEVSKAADEVTTLKGKMADRLRQSPVTVQVAAGTLPSPSVVHRQLESGVETVDL